MEDKSFEFLSRIYSELTEFRKETVGEVNELKGGVQGLRGDVQGLKNVVLRMENDHGRKLEALFDGYKRTYEKLEVLESKVDDISEKVDKHDIKIQVIEGGRK